jgi:hypothetical protein
MYDDNTTMRVLFYHGIQTGYLMASRPAPEAR